ncbi:MAG: hypothetical protein NXI16_07050 [Alphaproteobacteria bacterium]|nr:hypothetical protein [Alphaproteobacteria bacterium]
MKRTISVVAALLMVTGLLVVAPPAATVAEAQQINQRSMVKPKDKAKIGRSMSSSRAKATGAVRSQPGLVTRDCNTNVGNVEVEEGQRAPREVTTIIRGDVISLCN